MCALVDEVVRARMAHVAVPLNEGGVGFDQLEGVSAAVGLSHCVDAGAV